MGNKSSKPVTKPVDVLPNATAKQLLQSKFVQACKIGDVEVVRKLLSTISVNQGTKKFGVTGLLYACQNGHAEIVVLLLDEARGTINVNQTAKTGIGASASPLSIACSCGHASIVSALLDKARDKIDVNQATEAGATPIMMAADRGYDNIVMQFLNHPGTSSGLPISTVIPLIFPPLCTVLAVCCCTKLTYPSVHSMSI